ncbi:GTP cyclohydrolase II [Treponema sp. J25]|uniref:GTP cyclohydrolase II n=1 Tax=Treponema sp. J25 TaxID=2094121 RepID=UPI00104F7805|nr:GTP cyclohydrolase II [Treponema sp. J25]MCX7656764.1 GTP cyclohydrolase II [Treponemataceae bacterium]TCW61482.1 GTP cyclohydrolase II [Treponema sp. J25]
MLVRPTVEEIVQQDLEALRRCPYKLDCEHCEEEICVKLVSVADFPTRFGHFSILGFVNNRDRKDHIIILKGDIGDGEGILTRIHSACLTGDALGSLRCDCGPQLHRALELIEQEGRGIVLYHQEEGRGIGLVNKIRAYALQDAGYDTYDANIALGFAADERDFRVPAAMLQKIGVTSVRLLTNNPKKVEELEAAGMRVIERVPLELPAQEHNRFYLATKKERFGHFLSLDHTQGPVTH